MADEEKGWSPEDEIDPAKIQKEYLEVAKDMIGQMKADKENRKKAEQEFQKQVQAMPPMIGVLGPYKPPTPEEVSVKMKRAWEETKKIAPDAPDMVKLEIFRSMLHAVVEEGV
jgi:hypothetical protein